jgi:hypothetical protein
MNQHLSWSRTGLNLLVFDFYFSKTLASSQMITISLFVLPELHIGPDWGKNPFKLKNSQNAKAIQISKDFIQSAVTKCEAWKIEGCRVPPPSLPLPLPPPPPLYFEYLPIGLEKERRRDRVREKLLFNLGREGERGRAAKILDIVCE